MKAQNLRDVLVCKGSSAWVKPEKNRSIWDFASCKFPNDKFATDRFISDIYSAFWKGEFAPDGLTLLQDQSESGPESFNRLTRSDLARSALGSPKYADMGEADALEFLALFNSSDYRKMADLPDGFRYQFYPDNEASFHKRGLCATEAELETWYVAYQGVGAVTGKHGDAETLSDKAQNEGATSKRQRQRPQFELARLAIQSLWPETIPPHISPGEAKRLVQEWLKKNGHKFPPSDRIIADALRAKRGVE